VVFVAVGEHDAVDALGVLVEVGEVRQHEVHAGHVGLGEHDPAVEDQDPAVHLDAGAVAPISPRPPKNTTRTDEAGPPVRLAAAEAAGAGVPAAWALGFFDRRGRDEPPSPLLSRGGRAPCR